MSDAATDKIIAEAEKAMTAIESVVRTLGPLQPEERRRVIQAALVILGESPIEQAKVSAIEPGSQSLDVDLPSRVRMWMKQNSISLDHLAQSFDVTDSVATVIASGVPGRNNAEKTKKAYLLAGIANFLTSGDVTFDDKIARQLCESLGCYDSTNHSKYIREFGNSFTGSKDKGWKLTAPGLKTAASLIVELHQS